MNAVDEYADGTPIADGDYYNLVVYAVINKETAQCKLFVNPSQASYNTASAAYNDQNNLATKSVPEDLRTVAFLIARIPLRYTAAASGTLEFINPAGTPEIIDLRGVNFDLRDDSGIGASIVIAKIRGGLYYDSGGVTPSVEVAGEITPITTLFGSAANVTSPAAGRLAVGVAGDVVVTASLSVEMVVNTTQARFQIAVNGTPVAGAFATAQRGNSPVIHNPTISVPLTLVEDDYVSIFMTGSSVDLYDLTMSIKGEA